MRKGFGHNLPMLDRGHSRRRPGAAQHSSRAASTPNYLRWLRLFYIQACFRVCENPVRRTGRTAAPGMRRAGAARHMSRAGTTRNILRGRRPFADQKQLYPARWRKLGSAAISLSGRSHPRRRPATLANSGMRPLPGARPGIEQHSAFDPGLALSRWLQSILVLFSARQRNHSR